METRTPVGDGVQRASCDDMNREPTWQRIVIGMDFGEPSLLAARWITRHLGQDAEIVLAHAIDIADPPPFLRAVYPQTVARLDDARQKAETRLAEVVRSLGSGRVRAEIRIGRAEHVLAQLAEEIGADLLAVGPRRQQPGLRARLGSVAERVSRQARTSVFVARGLPDGPLSNVLAGLEGEATSQTLTTAAARLVDNDASRAVLIYVANSVPHGGVPTAASVAKRDDSEDEIARLARQWLEQQVAGTTLEGARLEVVFGDPGLELLNAVERLAGAALVIGRQHARAGDGPFLGRVAELILADGNSPVLVVDAASGG